MSELKIHTIGQTRIAELLPAEFVISDAQETLELMAESGALGAHIMIIHKQSLPEEFFDLSSRIAGEIVQKAVNYHFRLIIVGEFGNYGSKSLQDFIREGNRGNTVNFFSSLEEALAKLVAEN